MHDSKDIRRVRKCSNRDIRALILDALHAGHRYKMTKSGIIFYGPEGIAGTHLSVSDHRGARNFSADLRRAGITLEKGK